MPNDQAPRVTGAPDGAMTSDPVDDAPVNAEVALAALAAARNRELRTSFSQLLSEARRQRRLSAVLTSEMNDTLLLTRGALLDMQRLLTRCGSSKYVRDLRPPQRPGAKHQP